MLRAARFDGATFAGRADLSGITFEHDASFDRATFEGPVSFAGTRFGAQARFARASFEATATFDSATFGGHAWLAATRFRGDASFASAAFAAPAWFGGATFEADVTFEGATFAGDASFDDTTFGCHTFFTGADFGGEARFAGAGFANPPGYDGALFRGPGGAPEGAEGRMAWSGAPLASWPARVVAAAADHAGPLAAMVAGWLAGMALAALRYSTFQPAAVAAGVLVAAVVVARNLQAQGHTGQTRGKRLLGLTLVRVRDGTPPGPARSVGRYLAHALDLAPLGLGLLWPLWDRRRQTLADKVAATVVVRDEGWARPTLVGSPSAVAGATPAQGFG